MEFSGKVKILVDRHLEERKDLFLVDIGVSLHNDIQIVIDGDNGVSIQDCLDLSRAVESNLDREIEDFSLQVSSSGLSEPLKLTRQFTKNLGRELEIFLLNDTKIQGELIKVEEESITIKLRYRRKKQIGKGKENIEEDKIIPLNEIKKALVAIKF